MLKAAVASVPSAVVMNLPQVQRLGGGRTSEAMSGRGLESRCAAGKSSRPEDKWGRWQFPRLFGFPGFFAQQTDVE